MRKILLILCLALSTTITAQLPTDLVREVENVENYESYEGSIYLNSNYKASNLVHEKSGTFDAKLRYNIYNDALECQGVEETIQVVKTPTVHARINDDYFYFCEFKDQRGHEMSGYYVLVELTERYSIYKRYTLKIKDPIASMMVGIPGEPGKIRTRTNYYLEEKGVVMELPMNKKEILAAFSDKQSQLKSYVKKEKIKVRKEEDLIRLVARYNALKSDEWSIGRRSLLTNTNNSRN